MNFTTLMVRGEADMPGTRHAMGSTRDADLRCGCRALTNTHCAGDIIELLSGKLMSHVAAVWSCRLRHAVCARLFRQFLSARYASRLHLRYIPIMSAFSRSRSSISHIGRGLPFRPRIALLPRRCWAHDDYFLGRHDDDIFISTF